MLPPSFFDKDAQKLAKALLGKVIYASHQGAWLAAKIIETESYYLHEKGSHSSLGYTEKRKALFMHPGTIYMYYSHGHDSLNISARGEGNAVLIKSGFPYQDEKTHPDMIHIMQKLNPQKHSDQPRSISRLCAGQTLLCRSLGLKVKKWDQKQFNENEFYIADVGYHPKKILQAPRLGIPKGRDEHLPYRFIDADYLEFCTKKPKAHHKNSY